MVMPQFVNHDLSSTILKERHEQAAKDRLIREFNTHERQLLLQATMKIVKHLVTRNPNTKRQHPAAEKPQAVTEGATQ
jgi:predicted nucleic acid-binding protein